MANIREWLESAEAEWGEPIEAMVVGKHDRAGWATDPARDENIVLTREAGLAKVDQEYDNGYGGADCYPIWAWTASRVLFIHEGIIPLRQVRVCATQTPTGRREGAE